MTGRHRLAASFPRRLVAFIEAFRVLWVSGLAVLLVVSIGALLSVDTVQLKRVQYLALGTVFPGLALALATWPRLTRNPPASRFIELVLASFCLFVAGWFLIRHLNVPAIAISVLHGATAWAITRLGVRPAIPGETPPSLHDGGGAPDTMSAAFFVTPPQSVVDLRLLPLLLVTLVSWTAWIQVLPGHPLSDSWSFEWTFGTTFEAWFFRSPYAIPMFVLSLVIVVATLAGFGADRPLSGRSPGIITWGADVIALSVFGLAAFRTDQLFNDLDTYLHWSYFVGPADAVRQGNWLLWDVPSVYGFLAMVTVAAFPAEDIWASLYLVNSSLVLLSAIALFFLLRSLRSGPVNRCFAFLMTFAAVFVLPGDLNVPTGPQIWPSVGGFRFFWAYALLAVIVVACRNLQHGKATALVLSVGCIVWLVGALWSFESAVYCTAIWLPAYLLVVWVKALTADTQARSLIKIIGLAGLRSLIPLWLLAVTVCVLIGYYRWTLGHMPDLRSFVEMAVQWNARHARWTYDKVGPVAVFILFCIISTACVGSVRRARGHALGLTWAAWVTLWAGSSYLVAKTDRVTLFCLAPVLCCSIAVASHLYRHRGPHATACSTLAKTAYVPVLTVFLAVAFGHPERLVQAARAWDAGYSEFQGRLPVLDESAVELLTSVGDTIDCPVLLLGNPLVTVREVAGHDCSSFNRAQPPFASWLLAVDVLRPERVDVYVSRYKRRHSWKGYVLLAKDAKRDPPSRSRIGISQSDFLDRLLRRDIKRSVAENARYELVWVEMGEEATKEANRSHSNARRRTAPGPAGSP